MNRSKITRILLRGALSSAVLGLVFMVVALLPGSVEGTYNNFLWSCMCDGKHIMRLQRDTVVLYHENHLPARIWGRYETRADGVVEFYSAPWQEGEKEKLVMKGYPHLLVTKFVSEEEGRLRWEWKLPAIGQSAAMIRDQEITEDLPGRKGRLKRRVFDRDLKPLRHEAKLAKDQWRTVPDDEVPMQVYQAIRLYPDHSWRPRRKKGIATLGWYHEPAGKGEDLVPRSYAVGKRLGEADSGQARFASVMEQALVWNSDADAMLRHHLDLILVCGDHCHPVEYESGEANGEGPEGDRFRITEPMEIWDLTGMVLTSDGTMGTSLDKQILDFLRKATAGSQ